MNTLFSGAYAGRRVLVTGHTGFKGSWLSLWLDALGAEVSGLALPAATEPAHWNLLGLDRVVDHAIDLRDGEAVAATVLASRPEIIFHLAAQPLVRRSYRTPVETFDTNVMGLVNLFEAARQSPGLRAIVNVTTDKVYREPPRATQGYAEPDPLGGHDPYSASKACSELVTDCYRGSYFAEAGIGIATARSGNVIGGGDWSEDRLVPDLVRAAVSGQPLRLRNPDAIRPWQHVLDPLAGYLQLGQALLGGQAVEGAWNFGPPPDATLTVRALAERMTAHWPGLALAASPGPHPHEAATLRLDCAKAQAGLGWRPHWDATTSIDRTMDWYRHHQASGELRSRADLERYIVDAGANGAAWAR